MKFIIKPKGGGKTKELIKLASKTNSCIVCKNTRRIKYIQDLAKELNIIQLHIITYDGFLRRTYNHLYCEHILIDDIDELLQYISGHPILAVTATKSNT